MAHRTTSVCWKLVSITICLIGCLWQLNLICDQYFEYNVSTTVTVDNNPNMTPAGMAFCYFNGYELEDLTPLNISYRETGYNSESFSS